MERKAQPMRREVSANLSVLAAMVVGILLIGVFGPAGVQAQTYTVLGRFHGGDGKGPGGRLVPDAQGNLYGTTIEGGKDSLGTIYRYEMATGRLIDLYAFKADGQDGSLPMAELLRTADGTFYGTTYYGGVNNFGTVFMLTPGNTESVVHSFDSTTGEYPFGTLFKLDASGITVLFNFADYSGTTPLGTPLLVGKRLYGLTSKGGQYGGGTLFRMSLSDGSFAVVHSFGADAASGINPSGTLARDGQGNLYGITNNGGKGYCGTIFKMTPDKEMTTLFTFIGYRFGCHSSSNLLIDAAGALYGTLTGGPLGCRGAVFRLETNGRYTLLHGFDRHEGTPSRGVYMDAAGVLYGAAGSTYLPPGLIYSIAP